MTVRSIGAHLWYIGLSTDSRPVWDNMDTMWIGTEFWETDTGLKYYWTGTEWVEHPDSVEASAVFDITALSEDTAPTSDDLLLTCDDPAGSATNKKVTIANFATSLGLAITAGKTLTVQDNVTITGALGTGAYATIGNYAPLASPTFTGVVIVPDGVNISAPGLQFSNGEGIHHDSGNYFNFTGGSCVGPNYMSAAVFYVGSGSNIASMYGDAANTLAHRNGTNAQSLRIYRTYGDASNYDRLAFNTASGVHTIAIEQLGTGVVDADLALTPAGTGVLKFGAYTAGAASDSTGYITIKDAAGNTRKLMVQA